MQERKKVRLLNFVTVSGLHIVSNVFSNSGWSVLTSNKVNAHCFKTSDTEWIVYGNVAVSFHLHSSQHCASMHSDVGWFSRRDGPNMMNPTHLIFPMAAAAVGSTSVIQTETRLDEFLWPSTETVMVPRWLTHTSSSARDLSLVHFWFICKTA